jgi:hypothetical protein
MLQAAERRKAAARRWHPITPNRSCTLETSHTEHKRESAPLKYNLQQWKRGRTLTATPNSKGLGHTLYIPTQTQGDWCYTKEAAASKHQETATTDHPQQIQGGPQLYPQQAQRKVATSPQ